MNPVLEAGFKKNLFSWIVAITILAGFFSGYTSQATSQQTSRTQTEWVESRKSFKKVRCVFEKESNAPSEFNELRVHYEIFILLTQNRLTSVFSRVNQKLVQSIPDINSIHYKLRPQLADDYFISA